MLSQILRAARLDRQAYLRAVLSPNAAADGVLIVSVVYVILALVLVSLDDFELVAYGRFVIQGLISWLILAGAIYLIGRYLMEGEGSFPGVLATVALAHPVLLVLLIARIGLSPFLALLVSTVWFLAALVAGTRVALSFAVERAGVTVAGGYVVWLLMSRFLVV
jgi:hypothetical protein